MKLFRIVLIFFAKTTYKDVIFSKDYIFSFLQKIAGISLACKDVIFSKDYIFSFLQKIAGISLACKDVIFSKDYIFSCQVT
jgi:hypothetical protein